MDRGGLERITQAIRGGSEGLEVTQVIGPESTRSVRFISIQSTKTQNIYAAGQNHDPGDVNNRLDSHGLMFHEGQVVTPETEGPILKYLGSNGCYHAYEDVASK